MAAPLSDRLTGALRAMVNQWLKRTDYHALYPGLIVKTNADGTVDFQPNSAAVPGLGRIPLRSGLPGTTIQCHNAFALLGFEGGDPDSPYVVASFGLGPADLISIVSTTLKLTGAIQLHGTNGAGTNYAGKPVVREGDTIQVGSGTPGIVTITPPKSGTLA